jgi:hypothetical protein
MDKTCCTICNKIYAKTYMTQHKKTLLHLEDAYEYYVQERTEENFENYLYDNIYD